LFEKCDEWVIIHLQIFNTELNMILTVLQPLERFELTEEAIETWRLLCVVIRFFQRNYGRMDLFHRAYSIFQVVWLPRTQISPRDHSEILFFIILA
jgi:hypothetical protein